MRMLPIIVALIGFLVAPPAWADMPAPPGPVGAAGEKGAAGNRAQSVDPSENVRALNDQGLKRQDDIRALVEKRQDDIRALGGSLVDAQMKAVDRLSEVRYQHALDLLKAASDRLESEVKLRSDLGEKLTVKETDRINAIRAVDVQAVQVANERATSAATSLATQVVQSAEVLRTQQARQAEDLRAFVTSTNAETNKRITVLEQALSEGRGKQAFQDPAITALTTQMQTIIQQMAANKGTDTGQSNAVFYVMGAIGLLLAFGTLTVAGFVAMRQAAPVPNGNGYSYPQNGSQPPRNGVASA